MSTPAWIPWNEPDAPDWDAFVEAHPHGRFIHLTGFKRTVEDVYGLRANYWLVREGGRLRAVFPSFFHRAWSTGKKLISQPFSEYGGILFAADASPAERRAILSGLPGVVEESRTRGRLAYLEFRGFPDLAEPEKGMFQEVGICERAVLPLGPGFRLADRVDYSVRKNVRRARSSGVEVRLLKTQDDLRRIFYPLHLRSLKRLGSPPHPADYFLSHGKNLAGRMRVLAAWLGGRPVGALLGWVVGTSVQITDIATDERFFACRAADLLHYELIEWAAGDGFRVFDFGPVRYEGQRRYKLKWGVELHGYAHYCYPARTGRGPLSDQTAAARAARAVWRFVPSALAARLGRPLRRELAI
jgi:CelD/BcsL family acetyltransferase involved in cellulose biosynthesis